jgi:hypothetical protein
LLKDAQPRAAGDTVHAQTAWPARLSLSRYPDLMVHEE